MVLIRGTISLGRQNQCREDTSLQGGASLASQLLSSVEGTVCLGVNIWGPRPLTPLFREGSLTWARPGQTLLVADYDFVFASKTQREQRAHPQGMNHIASRQP